MNPDHPATNPESNQPTGNHASLDEAIQAQRRKKILDYESQSLNRADLLQANLELCCGDLMSLMALLRDDVGAVLATVDDPADRAVFLCNIIQWQAKAANCLLQNTEFLERRAAARKKAETVRHGSNSVARQEPLTQTGVSVKPKAK